MEGLKKKVDEVNKLMESSSPDLAKGQALVNELKILLVQLPEMQPDAVLEGKASETALLLARNVYEKAAGLCILREDISGFYRNVALLKDYYFDYAKILGQPSESQNLVIGLHLLLLLAENRIAEFHTELELVPAALRDNVYISFPITLEQFLTEGSYSKLLSAKLNIPEKSYSFFMELLMKTVREEIAKSCESAYDELLYNDAMRMLNISQVAELEEFCAAHGWKTQDQMILFGKEEEAEKEETVEESVFEMIKRSLHYAVELERIV